MGLNQEIEIFYLKEKLRGWMAPLTVLPGELASAIQKYYGQERESCINLMLDKNLERRKCRPMTSMTIKTKI